VNYFNTDQRSRALDVTALENALVDMLVHAHEPDLMHLGLKKGVMQLVSAEVQREVLASLAGLRGARVEVELGGSAANALRGMAVLGARTSYSSVVGDDENGHAFSGRLEKLGIVNRLVRAEGEPTGTCLVVVTPDGERTLNTHLGACLKYEKKHVPVEDIRRSKVFFTTGYVYDSPAQIEAVEHAFEVAKEADVKVAVDVADPFVVQRWGAQLRTLLETRTHIVFANAQEAQMLVGCTGADAARTLGEKVELVVVKDGAKGAYVCHAGRVIHVPTENVTPVDTTGAGDMFAGGFLYALTHGHSLETCGRLATLLAADTIMHTGVRLSASIPAKAKALLA